MGRRPRTSTAVATALSTAAAAVVLVVLRVDAFAFVGPLRQAAAPILPIPKHDASSLSSLVASYSTTRPSFHHKRTRGTAVVALFASREEYESMTVKTLRELVKSEQLAVKGLAKLKKADLINLLLYSSDSAAVAPPEPAEPDLAVEVVEEETIEMAVETEVGDVTQEEEVDTAATAVSGDEGPPEATKLTIENRESFAMEMARLSNEGAPPAQEEEVTPGVETLREFLEYSDYGIRKKQEQRQRGEAILGEIDSGDRPMPKWYYEDFVEEVQEVEDDPNAIAVDEWGAWDERDLGGPNMIGDWDPEKDADPNVLDPEFEYVKEIPKDEDGVELGYDPNFGTSYPIDERTIINPSESYIVDEKTRNATSVPKVFPNDDDPENEYNADVKAFRKSLKIVETYVDEYTEMEHPRYVAKWHGNPPLEKFPAKPFGNNRFTDPEDKTDFSTLDPYRARKKAVELARAKNNEWLPAGTSAEYHNARTKIYAEKGILAGSFIEGDKDPAVVSEIQPALDVLGDVADLLSIQDTVFRFRYHGQIKNKRGMAAWTETLIRDCGVDCTGVIFETGTRKRDPYYDNSLSETWHGPY